jgi:hypothetical protein
LEANPAQELAAEGSTSRSQRSEYEVGMRWLPAYEDVILEAKEHLLLEAATKQLD